jgi:hypothetical protein
VFVKDTIKLFTYWCRVVRLCVQITVGVTVGETVRLDGQMSYILDITLVVLKCGVCIGTMIDWPQSFAIQTAYPVTVTCWAVDHNNYKDRCFHWPVTSSVMVITDSLLVHLIILDTFSTFWWHLTLCQRIWMIFDSIFAYTWLFVSAFWWHLTMLDCFISTHGDVWFFVSVFSGHLTFCQCVLIILDFLSVHFDYTWLCQCILIALDFLSVHFDYTWLSVSAFWWHLTLLDSFISTSGNMWLFASAFWWYLILYQ